MAGISSFNRVLPKLIEPQGGKVILDSMQPSPLGSQMPVQMPSVGESEAPRVEFGQMLSHALDSVNQYQNDAAQAQQALMNGEEIELHDVMIKLEEAGLTMDLLLEVRNKLLNGYNELMHLPM